MTIVVVGSSSFVGQNIIANLSKAPVKIIGLQRSAAGLLNTFEIQSWRLGERLPERVIDETDWIVFCAHDAKSPENNTSGYSLMLKQLENYPKVKCIFISSFSAFKDAPSAYGQVKHQIESEFLKRDDYVIRPGLVVGKGGLFFDLFKSIARYPVVPVIGYSNAPITLIDINDLSQFVKEVIERVPTQKEFNVFNLKTTNQVELARYIKQTLGKAFLYLRLPILFFEIVVGMGTLLGIKLPITKENLEGYKKNTSVDRQSDILWLSEYKERSLREMLGQLKP